MFFSSRRILLFLACMSFIIPAVSSYETHMYIFHSKYCPHCAAELSFIGSKTSEYPELMVHAIEVSENEKNALIYEEMADAYGVSTESVPMAFIGEYAVRGYSGESTTGSILVARIEECIETKCLNPGVKVGIAEPENITLLKEKIVSKSKESEAVQAFIADFPDASSDFEIDRDYEVRWESGSKAIIVHVNSTTGEISKVFTEGMEIEQIDAPEITEEEDLLPVYLFGIAALLAGILAFVYFRK